MKNEKGYLMLVLMLLLVAALVVWSAMYYSQHKTAYTNVEPNFENKVQREVQEAKTATYKNEKLGFEFTYTKDLSVKEDTEAEYNKRENGDFRKNFTSYVRYEPGKFLGAVSVLDSTSSFDKSPFTVWVFDNPNNLSIDQWYKNYWYFPFLWGQFSLVDKAKDAPTSEATVSGKLAKYAVINHQPNKPTFYYLSDKGKMYLLRELDIPGDYSSDIFASFLLVDVKDTIEGKECGGFTNPTACLKGYKCVSTTNTIDDPGKCIKE